MAKLKTGRHTGAIKSARQAERHALKNRAERKRIRGAVKDLLSAIAKKDKGEAKKLLPQVSSLWDKAAKTGLVHRKAADRRKSRLAQKVQALAA